MLASALRTTRLIPRSYHPPNRGFAKLTLVGYLGTDPELRTTKTDREYVSYTVATRGNRPPPAPDGTQQDSITTWHRIYAFNPAQASYLTTLTKGSLVYVEADYELREPIPDAAPGTPGSQRQVFLRQEKIKLLKRSDRHEEGE